MHTEARKINLIQAVLKINNENILEELETVLKLSKPRRKSSKSAREFAGTLSKKDANLIDKAIKDGCEQIHQDDWK